MTGLGALTTVRERVCCRRVIWDLERH